MERITLNAIKKKENKIEYDFSVSDGFIKFFSGRKFIIEYPENMELVPDAIAAVPFVCNVLPLIWLADALLEVPELDQAFYDCIPDIQKGYSAMFPESVFAGTVVVRSLVRCDIPGTDRCAAFFSGGLDSVQTLISHLDEKPELISIWGSDIRYDNDEGWKLVHQGIAEYSEKYGLKDVVIKSTFREFEIEWKLDESYKAQLKDGWWHGVQHGIGLISHAAPYAYIKGLSIIYFASSNCPEDGIVRCASHPSIDNQVRFANCQIIHDGFEYNRQGKVHNVVDYVRRTGDKVSLHVCWQSQAGSNCCLCEKCYRTMAGIIAECADPKDYGFENVETGLKKSQDCLIGRGEMSPFLSATQWVHTGRKIVENKEKIQNTEYWKYIKWMEKIDFLHPETIKVPLMVRLRVWVSRTLLARGLRRIRRLF